MSAGPGVATVALLHPAGTSPNCTEIGAALVSVAAFFFVSSIAVAAIRATTGAPWRSAALDGLDAWLLFVGAEVTTGLALSAYPWALPLAVLSLLILRQVLAGHFQARHARLRLHGLFEANA